MKRFSCNFNSLSSHKAIVVRAASVATLHQKISSLFGVMAKKPQNQNLTYLTSLKSTHFRLSIDTEHDFSHLKILGPL
jgi:hypothetical protein